LLPTQDIVTRIRLSVCVSQRASVRLCARECCARLTRRGWRLEGPMADFIERQVRFPSAGRPPVMLEGNLAQPVAQPPEHGFAVAVLCHPQPASSSMDDPLLRQLAATLATAGVIVLRFNFRGVGASEGEQTDGRLE